MLTGKYWLVRGGASNDAKVCADPTVRMVNDGSNNRDTGVRCCNLDDTFWKSVCHPSFSGEDANGRIETLTGITGGSATFIEAAIECAAHNKKLCPVATITNGGGSVTGCGHDARMIWSGTQCDFPPPAAPPPPALPPSSPWHLAPVGDTACDYGVSAQPGECTAAGAFLAVSLNAVQLRGIQTCSGNSCDSNCDIWGGVPQGCSVQSGNDWTSHYRYAATVSACFPGSTSYQLVCSTPAPPSHPP